MIHYFMYIGINDQLTQEEFPHITISIEIKTLKVCFLQHISLSLSISVRYYVNNKHVKIWSQFVLNVILIEQYKAGLCVHCITEVQLQEQIFHKNSHNNLSGMQISMTDAYPCKMLIEYTVHHLINQRTSLKSEHLSPVSKLFGDSLSSAR